MENATNATLAVVQTCGAETAMAIGFGALLGTCVLFVLVVLMSQIKAFRVHSGEIVVLHPDESIEERFTSPGTYLRRLVHWDDLLRIRTRPENVDIRLTARTQDGVCLSLTFVASVRNTRVDETYDASLVQTLVVTVIGRTLSTNIDYSEICSAVLGDLPRQQRCSVPSFDALPDPEIDSLRVVSVTV